MGIEPTRPAWKAGILPLNYTRTLIYNALYSNKLNLPCQEFFEFLSFDVPIRKTGEKFRQNTRVRVSFGIYNKKRDVDRVTDMIYSVCKEVILRGSLESLETE